MRSYWLPMVVLVSMSSTAWADDARPAEWSPERVVAEASQSFAGKQMRELAVEHLDAVVAGAPPKKPGNKKRNCSVKLRNGICKG